MYLLFERLFLLQNSSESVEVDVLWYNCKPTHNPVLLEEVLEFLPMHEGACIVDATFGGGGYSRALLERSNCSIIAIDRDPEANYRSKDFKEKYGSRFIFHLSNFDQIDNILNNQVFDGIVFDLGVSSFQLDRGERGFSFKKNGPLDMRMGNSGITAEIVINTYKEEELAQIIKLYGEERFAKKISHAIINRRSRGKIKTTFELAEIIREIVPKTGTIDPATKTFQAFRIFINDELKSINMALNKVIELCVKNSLTVNIVTVSFHSLEDRIVKNWINRNVEFFKENDNFSFQNLTARVITPGEIELKENKRSRSAKLRAVKFFSVANSLEQNGNMLFCSKNTYEENRKK